MTRMTTSSTGRYGRLGPRWLPLALFVGIPVWWALGLSGVIAPLLAIAAGIALLVRGWTTAPRGFGLWLLFVAWVLIAILQVPDLEHGVAGAYRLVHYLAGTVFFLYVFNARRDSFPIETLVRILAGFWVVVVLGGVVGTLAPSMTFRTPTEAVLPASLANEDLIHELVSASTSSEVSFPGLGFHRPKAPFPYTNQWGAMFALTLPFGVGAFALSRSALQRKAYGAVLVLSAIPLVFSLDRGAWLSICVGFAYALIRLLTFGKRLRRSSAVVVLVAAAGAVAVLILATPLRDIILVRLERGYGDESRWTLYSESVRLAKDSWLFGYGSPVEVPGLPSAGTHGHLWTILVSFGVVALFLFLSWFALVIWRTRTPSLTWTKSEQIAAFCCHVCVVVAIAQLPYYEWLPWGLPVVMMGAAAAWREWLVGRPARDDAFASTTLVGRVPQVAVGRE